MRHKLSTFNGGLIAITSALLALALVDAQGAPREVASATFPSVAMVVTEDAHGRPLAIGSGFFVKKDLLASNAHVVEGAAGGHIKLIGHSERFELKGIAAIDVKHDIVLLAVEHVDAPALAFGDFAKLAVGDPIFSVGSPQGLEGTFAAGIVSAIREIEADRLLQHTAPISPGSSGGPILDSEGQVVGVAVAAFKDGQNLNFAVPVTYLAALMENAREIKPLAASLRVSESSSYLHQMGESSSKGISIGSFLWASRDLEFVIRNNLRSPVTSIRALIIFRDEEGEVCDFKEVNWPDSSAFVEQIKVPSLEDMKKGAGIKVVKEPVSEIVIPAGLAKPYRVSIESSTRLRSKQRRPEVRLLGFEIVNTGK